MRRWVLLVTALGLVAGLTSACRLPKSGEHTVVASFYPLYFIAERVAGRYNDVVDLTPPGVEPHEYELTVRQVAEIDNARVGFYEKRSGAVGRPGDGQRLPRPRPRRDLGRPLPRRWRVPAWRPSDDKDPHFWQDPTLMAEATAPSRRRWPRPTPRTRRTTGRRAHAWSASSGAGPRLRAGRWPPAGSTRSWSATTRSSTSRRRYHLDVVPIAGLEPDAEPSLQRLHDLADLIRDRRRDDGVLRDPGQPRPGASRWPATSGSRRRCSTRSRG